MELKHLSLFAVGIVVGSSHAIVSTLERGNSRQDHLSVRDFPDLVGGLKSTPGCLDVKTGTLDNGKQLVIYAWFKNKQGVQNWYASPMHRDAMKKFFPNLPGRPKSLSGFTDEKAPLLVVATVTPSNKPAIEGSPLAVSQIGIEVYTPVPGGVTIGGGFGPRSLEVPGMVRMD